VGRSDRRAHDSHRTAAAHVAQPAAGQLLHVAKDPARPRLDDAVLAPYLNAEAERDLAAVRADPAYRPTPVLSRPVAARRFGVAGLDLKDEGQRLAEDGLGSFKVLGVLAALSTPEVRDADPLHTLTCASDGNYGRAVAWAAQRRGLAARIFLAESVSQARGAAIERYGAEVVRVAGGYDAAVQAAAEAARAPGVLELSDTGHPGGSTLPLSVSRAYRLIAEEYLEQCGAPPTHLFVPVGVGSLAAGMVAGFRRFGHAPIVVAVEPLGAASLLASLRAGRVQSLGGPADSLMIGLACETPCTLAWPLLQAGIDHALALPDAHAAAAMRRLAEGDGDAPLVAGETGAAAYAALVAVAGDPALRAALQLDQSSRVLVPITEGATDPEIYRRLVGRSDTEVAAGRP
jgi:diaminopropionate ammonia-lyase